MLELTVIDGSDHAPLTDAAVKVDLPDATSSLTTDTRGIVAIELPTRPRYFTLHVHKTGFVPKLIVWDFHRSELHLPERFALRMERGKTIGGIVRNESGEPVEGTDVLIALRGANKPDVGEPRIEHDIWETPARTDAQGRWQFDEAPADLQFLRLRVDHPDYISKEHLHDVPPNENFQNGTAVLTLLRGVPCEGTVTDAQGQPIAGVEVIFGEAGAGSPSTPTRETDANGHFHFGGLSIKRRGEAPILSFLKDGYAPELVELQPASVLMRKDVVLRPGKTLRVQFTDKQGAPIGGVMMAVEHWREHRPFHLRFHADESGLARWENAPPDGVGFAVLHEAFQRHSVKLTATDEIQTVVLQRPAGISGRVIDARTKQPIPVFRLTMGRIFHDRRTWSDWSHEQAREFRNGEFRVAAQSPVMMMNREGGPGEIGFRRLRVEADGYRPAISREIANEEEAVECHFELEPGAALEGIVRDPRGHPVADAAIVVTGSGNPVMVRNGELFHCRYFTVKSNEQGRYVMPLQEEDFSLLVIHPEAGYLVTSWSKLQAEPDIQLLAWGALEVASTAQEQAQVKYFVRPVLDDDAPDGRIRFDSTPVKAGSGLWTFQGLPAGPLRLGTYNQAMDEGPVVTIENGKTARIDLGAGRRSLVGQILLPVERVSTQEPLAHFRLRRKPRSPNPGNEPFERTYTIDSQGKFRIDDISPGSYQLFAIFFRTMPTAPHATPDVAGIAAKDFELPGGSGAFDLGTLPVLPPDNIRSV